MVRRSASKLVAPADLDRCIPWRIRKANALKGPRIGGCGPLGEDRWKLPEDARYFGTFPLARDPERELSVYVRPFADLLGALNEGAQHDDRVLCVVHAPSKRGADRRHASNLTPHGIRPGRPCSDWVSEDGTKEPYGDHKIGGRPYCCQELELEGVAELVKKGFVHVLQVTFPGAQDGGVGGDWPFGNGVFNLFLRPPFGARDVRWFLQD